MKHSNITHWTNPIGYFYYFENDGINQSEWSRMNVMKDIFIFISCCYDDDGIAYG